MKFFQTNRNGCFSSTYTFPSAEHYPKNFNTKISNVLKKNTAQQMICPITGKPAKYKDPLTL